MDDNLKQDITFSEAAVLAETFGDVAKNIKSELDDRIISYSRSLLHKYYNNLFYYIPKHCMLGIEGGNTKGYKIAPDEQFYIYDKKNQNSLLYTPRIETNILPAEKAKTIRVNDNTIAVEIEFNKSFDYNRFTLWLEPHLVDKKSYSMDLFLNDILNLKATDMFAKVEYVNGAKAIKNITLSKLKLQLKPIEVLAASIHSKSLTRGFDVEIENLFSYKSDEVKKIVLYFKVDTNSYRLYEFEDLFKINILPVFNLFDDYSYSFYTNRLLSQVKLSHNQDKNAIPTSIISIYENNKLIDFDNFYFSGINEYYFNVSKQKLDYNMVFPNLVNKSDNTKVHLYATWTQDIEISNFIEVSSAITPMQTKINPLSIYEGATNFELSSATIFNLVDKLVSNNIYEKATFISILSLLGLSKDKMELFQEIVYAIKPGVTKYELVVSVTKKYSKEDNYFLRAMLRVICQFININTFVHIKDFIINEEK